MSQTAKSKLRIRLNSYWKLELANIVLLPACMIFLSFSQKYDLGIASYVAMIPMCGLLFIGGIYWRAKCAALDEGSSAVWSVMPLISKAQWPLAILSLGALGLMATLWLDPDFAASRGDKWTATTAAILAGLEYINYYHRQLQHFDHLSDFKKLLSGKGFRKAQLAKDLKTWRSKRS